MVLLPFNNFIEKGKINEKGLNSLYSIYNQEVERIKVVQNEIDTYYLGSKKDGYNEGFHYILQDIGIKGTNGNKSVKIFTHSDGTYFYLDIDNNNNVVNLSKEELYYNEKQEDGSTIKKEINLNNLTPKGLKLFNFANKNAKLNEKDLSEEEIKQRLSNFIDFQVDEYIKLLEDKGLLKEGEVNLLPKSFISGDQLDKNALKNAFLNDYLMSYSINSLLYGDNAESTKNSNDFVKRAGGMIGSGPNYGSGLTNIIPIRSEVVNKIDITDAQTFNTPFHHLSVILNSKSIDNRIKEIYQGIDSGLNYYVTKETELDSNGNKVEVEKIKKISKEDYDYLYDNNAQHQPNKTQGFGIDWFLKTSISPILRETTSRLKNYSKENLKEALLIHKELFDLKLQALPSDNTYITYLTKKYQNLFEPIEGKEYKHNLLNDLELNNAIAVYDSAWKRSKYNIHEISNGKPFLYKDSNGKKVISSISVPNASLIDQQKTDGVKKQITHPTQFLRLISTEQINETLIYFKNKEINVGTALSVYEKQLAERTDKGFKALKKEVLDENGEAAWDLLLKSFIDSIEKSSADPQQLELFQQGNSSKPKYNLNNPAIETKFQSMFLSFVSSNTLKQKVAGSKLSLKSSIGHELEREIDNEGNVIKTFTTEQSKRDNAIRGANRVSQRLRHDVYDKVKHEYYSEIVVSERFLRKFGFTAEQFHKGEIPEEFLYISGVRIPTEDKHSMINCKIVDILPDSYGNVVMLPNEIVELSGADFDIDALYVRVNQTYTNVLNKKTGIYSSYLTQPTLEEAKEQAYNEYLSDAYDNKKISSTFNDLKTNSKELIELNYEKNIAEISLRKAKEAPNVFTREQLVKPATSELLGIIDEIKALELTLLKQSFDINKIIFNKEQWLKDNSTAIENNYNAYQTGDISNINPLTKGETNNMLLELERKLINNNGNNKITNTPTSLKLFKDLIETLEGEGLINKDLGYGVHDMLSKTLADISISTGAANIGPVALFNNLFGILVKNKVSIQRKVGEEVFLEPFVNYSRDENNKLVDEKDAQRVQDSIATLLAAMTDNAKEQMANLFNLTTETLPVALSMIGVGHNFNNVMLLMKSPIVKKISELSQSYNKTIQSKQDYDDSKGNRELQKKVESIFQLEGESEFKDDLNYQTLLDSLKNKFIEENISQQTTEQPINKEIKPTDRIIWGHPAIGKSYAAKKVKMIDFDSYKLGINKKYNLYIAPGLSDVELRTDDKTREARENWRYEKPENAELWNQFIREAWKQAKKDAKKQNAILFASDLLVLREFGNEVDKAITMSDELFFQRSKQRNNFIEGEKGTKVWKSNLNKAVKNFQDRYGEDKVITTDKYLSDLLNQPTEIKPNEVKGIEINSYQTGLGNSLTNVHYATNGKSAFDIIPSDKSLTLTKEAKAKWYKSNNAQTRGIPEGVEGDKYDMDLMVGLITDKLKQYPNLVEQINQNRGLSFLQKSTHNMGNGRWSSKNPKNMFMNSLIQAYKNVNQPTEIKPKIEVVNRYSDSEVKANPDKIYVFGDNTDRKGTGGQAAIRNNPNAFGIATKVHPTNNENAFMSDKDLESNKKTIDFDIQKILDQNKPLVFPKDGFGTGLAKLKEKAPQTYQYLKEQLLEKFGFNNDTGELTQEQPIVEETKDINKTGIKKIISGGQTGGDLGGLEGARLLNIETGGTAPPNFISGNKSEKELLQGYGLVEGEQDPTTYTKRTMKNVDDSDGTVAILWGTSVGTGKTIGYAQTKKWQYGDNKSKNNGYKPVLVITSKDVDIAAQELKDFVLKNNIQILNIAGHREVSQKGIQDFTKKVIQKAFENNDSTKPLRTKAEQLDLFNTSTSNNQKAILKRISNEYFHYKKASNVFSNLQNLLQLIKGFKSTFAESEKFITALNNLG